MIFDSLRVKAPPQINNTQSFATIKLSKIVLTSKDYKAKTTIDQFLIFAAYSQTNSVLIK